MINRSPGRNAPDVVVRPFHSGDAGAFRRLNEEWITAYFQMEAKDRETLGDPEGTILAVGGQILVAESGEQVVGCIGLMPLPDGGYEVVKMAVSPSRQGRGIGRRLLRAAIAWAQEQKAPRLYLESNARLATALRLYEAAGFRHLPADETPATPYVRADVFMELWLTR